MKASINKILTTRLSPEDRNFIFALAQRLVAAHQDHGHTLDVLAANVEKRMQILKVQSLDQYLSFALRDNREYAELISALTIHHTMWFREIHHFEFIERKFVTDPSDRKLRVASLGCSTGEEVYSLAMVLEKGRSQGLEYSIEGYDIDQKSLESAQRAIYPMAMCNAIPKEYHSFMRQGSGKSEGFFTVIPEIRSRVSFRKFHLANQALKARTYDLILCRNVLIYFSEALIDKIIAGFCAALVEQGYLILGHSESLRHPISELVPLTHATYQFMPSPESKTPQAPLVNKPTLALNPRPSQPQIDQSATHILVVDDAPLIRRCLTDLFTKEGFQVTTAESAAEATQAITKSNFDLVTLDVEMPGGNGPPWLKEQRKKNLRVPVVMITSLTSAEVPGILGALEDGAQDFIEKKTLSEAPQAAVERIKSLLKPRHQSDELPSCPRLSRVAGERPDLVLVGASTGGPQVLHHILGRMPKPFPPIVVVQHITKDFAELFAERLAENSGLTLKFVDGRDILRDNCIYMGRGDSHIALSEANDGNIIIDRRNILGPDELHVPSIDQMFRSAQHVRRAKILAFLLTGMGKDGSEALRLLKKAGVTTVIQDELSSVVFGMPREALRLGGACFQANPDEIRRYLQSLLFDLKRA